MVLGWKMVIYLFRFYLGVMQAADISSIYNKTVLYCNFVFYCDFTCSLFSAAACLFFTEELSPSTSLLSFLPVCLHVCLCFCFIVGLRISSYFIFFFFCSKCSLLFPVFLSPFSWFLWQQYECVRMCVLMLSSCSANRLTPTCLNQYRISQRHTPPHTQECVSVCESVQGSLAWGLQVITFF